MSTGRSSTAKIRPNSAIEVDAATPMHLQRRGRAEQPVEHARERDGRADRDRRGAVSEGHTGDPVDDRRNHRETRPATGDQPLAAHRRGHLGVGQGARLGREPRSELALPAQRLGQQDACHGQRLLHQRRHAGQLALAAADDLAAVAPEPQREDQEQRHDDQADEGELPFHDERGHRDRRRGDHVLDGRAGRVRDDVVDAADVVGDPRLQVAGSGTGEEAQRHPLQMLVHADAQVTHDALTDDAGQPRRCDAEHRVRRRGGDHAVGQPRHEDGAALGQGAVDDLAQEERRRDAGDALQRRDEHEGRDPPPIRREQPGDATDRQAVRRLGSQLGGRRERGRRRAHGST